MKWKYLTLTLAVMVLAVAGSCDKNGADNPGTDNPITDNPGTDDPGNEQPVDVNIPVESVSISLTELELSVGDSGTLTVSVLPENATDRSVSWSSDNNDVASVSEGVVTAIAAGNAIITATTTDGGKTAFCNVTVKAILPEGALTGAFSVSEGRKVHFSKGNLQATFDGDGYSWGFADNQYDYVGAAAGNMTIDSQEPGSVVDLFGWSSESTYYGISTSMDNNVYSGEFKDWGTAIDDKGTWRTLSGEFNGEWRYLMEVRDNAMNLKRCGVTVCGCTNCLVIAPDGYIGTIEASYDAESWAAAESAGLVCLPAAGERDFEWTEGIIDTGAYGYYWTSSLHLNRNQAYWVYFYSSNVAPNEFWSLYVGCSVRLVTDAK